MRFLFLLLTLCFALAGSAQGRIVVRIAGFENNKGSCIACLYNNARAFAGKGAPLACTTVVVTNKTATAGFENVAEGTYAVSVIHDANNNKKFDTNFVGIPKEGYGASQNKLPFAAAPKFEENKFVLSSNATVTINIQLRYLL